MTASATVPPSGTSATASARPGLGPRRASLVLSELAFHDAAVHATESEIGGDAAGQVNDNDPNALHDTDRMVKVARAFLRRTCPEFLDALGEGEGGDGAVNGRVDRKSAIDRLVKVGRNVSSTMRAHRIRSSLTLSVKSDDGDDSPAVAAPPNRRGGGKSCVLSKAKVDASLALLAEECFVLAGILQGEETRRVPKVRFGRTELQMPVVTLGCMRFQQTWKSVNDMTGVEDECQSNLVEILRYALRMGVNHIETAKMYGCSEMQIGHALKKLLDEGEVKREDVIIQTKGGISSQMTPEEFRSQFLGQLDLLGLDYVDLFSVHGLNTDDHLLWLFDHTNGPSHNLYPVLEQLRTEGKIRHVGFSTHGRTDVIRRVIDTDKFDYVNLHYHFCGSYTASGDDINGVEGNLSNVRLAREKDMGLFVISPYDKGGRLYAPSQKLRDLTLPDMEPMTYGSVWLWQHGLHDEENAPVHTIVCGAARPSDLDQPILASFLLEDDVVTLSKRERIANRLTAAMEEALGEEWASKWYHNLPNCTNAKQGTQHGNIVWMYNVIKAFGMVEFAKERYKMCAGNSKLWNTSLSKEDNMKKASPGWSWCPGTTYDPALAGRGEYDDDLKDCPEEFRHKILEAERLVHSYCAPPPEKKKKEGEEKKEEEEHTPPEVPLEWQTSYDMRPWTAYPERG